MAYNVCYARVKFIGSRKNNLVNILVDGINASSALALYYYKDLCYFGNLEMSFKKKLCDLEDFVF